MSFTIPARADDAKNGSDFGKEILNTTGTHRDALITKELLAGNIPDFMRSPAMVCVDAEGHHAEFQVMPDYLCVGVSKDFLRVPLLPGAAQAVADAYGASLPTRLLVNAIWKQAGMRLPPRPMVNIRDTTGCFIDHNLLIELQLAGRIDYLAGHKKDIILTPKLLTPSSKGLAIYGWHDLRGKPIQGLNAISHSSRYVDYSHGVRLVSREVLVDGALMDFQDLLQDPVLHVLVSDEGPSSFLRYPPR